MANSLDGRGRDERRKRLPADPGERAYRRLALQAIVVPTVALGAFEFGRHALLERTLPAAAGNLVAALVVAGGATLFATRMMREMRRVSDALAAERERAAVLAERNRIARDMHDGVAQALFYLNAEIGHIERRTRGGELAEAVAELSRVKGALDGVYEQVRAAILDLKEAEPAEGLVAAIGRRLLAFGREAGVEVDFAPPAGLWVEVSDEARGHVLAVLQEVLANVRKHAATRRVTARIGAVPGGVALEIADDGRGFTADDQARGGIGLSMAQERARLIGGELRVESAPARGTTARLTIPAAVRLAR